MINLPQTLRPAGDEFLLDADIRNAIIESVHRTGRFPADLTEEFLSLERAATYAQGVPAHPA